MLASLCLQTHAAASAFYFGADISSLSDLEKLGAVFHDQGKPVDAITLFHTRGMNLFRLRLFVNPDHDFNKSGGATQDLAMVLALAKRIKNSGAGFSLALHYSDTWADPAHQTKPAAWKDLPFDALKIKVTSYTTEVLQAMKNNHTNPDIVEVGNETTNGMLWPDGHIGKNWDNYCQLLTAGTNAVRSQLPDARILIHINAGGKSGVPLWFFSHLQDHKMDYDLIGLSFYPTWNDSLDSLRKNLVDLSAFNKNILVIETAYPHKPMTRTPQTQWPMSPGGQTQFLHDLIAAVKSAPNHLGVGVVWWYPEAVPLAHENIWNGGAMGLFDDQANLLPAAVFH